MLEFLELMEIDEEMETTVCQNFEGSKNQWSVLTLIILIQYGIIPSKKVGFFCKDPLFSHEYTGETVTRVIHILTAFLLPVMVILSTEMLRHQSFKRINIFLSWILFKEGSIGTMLILFLTMIAKVLVGEHRPNFFEVCEPDTARNCTEGSFVETYVCISSKYGLHKIANSSLSFPSGHASTVWFIGTFSSFVIYKRLPTINAGSLIKPFLISVCLTWSLVCSLTRITDRLHHWWDVLAGSIIGILGSFYSIYLAQRKLQDVEHENDNKMREASIAKI